jgi:hypothetical protein
MCSRHAAWWPTLSEWAVLAEIHLCQESFCQEILAIHSEWGHLACGLWQGVHHLLSRGAGAAPSGRCRRGVAAHVRLPCAAAAAGIRPRRLSERGGSVGRDERVVAVLCSSMLSMRLAASEGVRLRDESGATLEDLQVRCARTPLGRCGCRDRGQPLVDGEHRASITRFHSHAFPPTVRRRRRRLEIQRHGLHHRHTHLHVFGSPPHEV